MLVPIQLLAFVALGVLAGCGSRETDNAAVFDFYQKQMRGNDLPAGTFALTFDDGPGERTAELAELLSWHKVRDESFLIVTKIVLNTKGARRVRRTSA